MIIARSGPEPVDFQPRQPKKLPRDWSPNSPDHNVLAAAGRYKAGLHPVNAFTARDATTLDLCKHSVLLTSLDAVDELHRLHCHEKMAGHRWAPLGPPADGPRPAEGYAEEQAPASTLAAAHAG